ncbi:MAG TPA: hypothetical protein VM598_14850, partial [Bdellovibrionota bacterium]|nr:hypothetical protein [Bdellovibrionota bacterium]
IDQDAGTGTQDQLAIAATGSDVYFAWRDNRGGIFSDIYSRAATAQGAEFLGNEKRVDTDSGNTVARNPSIAVAGANVHVVWVDERGSDPDIRYNSSSDRAQTWRTSDFRVDQAPMAVGSDSPSISASGSNVFVAWRDERNGNGDVFFRASISGGESWLADDKRIDSDAGAAEVAAPSACSDGVSVVVGWSDSRSGNADIRLNRSVQ